MSARDTLGLLRIEDGRRWVEAAYEFQLQDAEAILDGATPYHFLTRPRGASKTTDLAGVALALLLDVQQRDRLYWLAADREQGQLAIDAISGFQDRTPALTNALTITANTVEAIATGARLAVLPADSASSWGLRPAAVFIDEVTMWSDTPGPRRLWESVSSAVAKRSDARLVVAGTAGDPAHFSRTILAAALKSKLWRVHELPGPSPWMDADRLEEQRARLSDAMFARLFLNRWTTGEDRLATVEQLRDCVSLDGPQEYVGTFPYVVTVDLGLKRDRTVCAVAHRDGRKVVLDRIAVWQGTRSRPVQLAEVEEWIAHAARSYGNARIVADPWQSTGMAQRLHAGGFQVAEFTFSAQSVGRIAAGLFNAIRNGDLALPDDEELLDELAHVRLRETSPGVFRMDHDSGRHDDRAVALGLAVHSLLSDYADPVEATRQLEALMQEMKPVGREVPTEQWAADWIDSSESWLSPRRSWRDAFDASLPTLGGRW